MANGADVDNGDKKEEDDNEGDKEEEDDVDENFNFSCGDS